MDSILELDNNMTIDDLDFWDDKYNAQRNDPCPKCIRIFDFPALFADIRKCDDFHNDFQYVLRKLMTKSRGCMNPKEIRIEWDLFNYIIKGD